MSTRFVVNFDFRIKNEDIQLSQIIEHFSFIMAKINYLFQVEKDWYETGYSRKQALNQMAFHNGHITDKTRLKWERRYKKICQCLLIVYGMLMMMSIAVAFLIERCFMMKKIEFRWS